MDGHVEGGQPISRSGRAIAGALVVGLITAAAAGAVGWTQVGGDGGRSGLQPLTGGTQPIQQLWQATGDGDRRVQTSVVVTGFGYNRTAPRAVYGTADGRLHLRDVFTGQPVGDPDGVLLTQSHNPDTFSGYLGGQVNAVSASRTIGTPAKPADYGELYAVYNDDNHADTTSTDPNAEFTDDIAIAQVDEKTGQLIQTMAVPGTDKFTISSTPLLGEPDADGNRTIFFTMVDREDYDYQYQHIPPPDPDPIFGEDTSIVHPTLVSIPILHADDRYSAKFDFDNMATQGIGFINPLASPSLVMIGCLTAGANSPAPCRDNDADPLLPALPFVAVATANGDAPVQTYNATDITSSGPSSAKLDKTVSATHLVYAQTVSVPVAPDGRPPGVADSTVYDAPALLVATTDPNYVRTVVHRLLLTADGAGLVETARSAPLVGDASSQLALSQIGGGPGTRAGRVVVATSKNLYALKGSDLSLAWKLDRKNSLTKGATGFSHTSPAIGGPVVYAQHDGGEQVGFNLSDGSPLEGPQFAPFDATVGQAFGQPAVSSAGVVLYASEAGVFAYRNACGNRVTGTNQSQNFAGTVAGDDIDALGGNDTIDAQDGDDCIYGGAGNDRADGGAGNDKLLGGSGDDLLLGRAGDDFISGGDGDDLVGGDDGNDKIELGDGDDIAKGGNGNDAIQGGAGNDHIFGNGDNDRIKGGTGNDIIKGAIGDDRIDGGRGNNHIDGGPGNDFIKVSGFGESRIYAGPGDDQVHAANGRVDLVSCGDGIDEAIVDRGDTVYGCEHVAYRKIVHKHKHKHRAKRKHR